ncbi:MAG: hypothetical protein L0Y54_18580 [Sporichthyaceae bacterium]|nr:hypothetical protein [Sporichthyaceae bacterium]
MHPTNPPPPAPPARSPGALALTSGSGTGSARIPRRHLRQAVREFFAAGGTAVHVIGADPAALTLRATGPAAALTALTSHHKAG